MFRILPGLLVIAAAMTLAAGGDVRAQEGNEHFLFIRETFAPFRQEIWTLVPNSAGETWLDVGVDSPHMVDVSIDGTQIVFGGGGNLYTANIDGSDVTRLPLNNQEHSATWSPDGGRLVFTDIGPEGWTWDLYIANVDGSSRRLLVDSDHTADFADWSPDGMKIAFSMKTSAPNETHSRFDIFTVNADGSGLTQLTSDGSSWFPDWSPDGTRIAFTSYRNKYSVIYTMNADGSDERPLFAGNECDRRGSACLGEEWPDWSPDGTRIAFHSRDTGADIWYANVDGSGLTQVTSGPAWEVHPQWFAAGAAPVATPQATPSNVPPSPSPTPCVTTAPASPAPTASPMQPVSFPTKAPPPVGTPTEPPFSASPHAEPPRETPEGPTGPTPSPMNFIPAISALATLPPTATASPGPAASPTPCLAAPEDDGGISPEATMAAAAALGALLAGPPLLAGGALALRAWRRAKPGQ